MASSPNSEPEIPTNQILEPLEVSSISGNETAPSPPSPSTSGPPPSTESSPPPTPSPPPTSSPPPSPPSLPPPTPPIASSSSPTLVISSSPPPVALQPPPTGTSPPAFNTLMLPTNSRAPSSPLLPDSSSFVPSTPSSSSSSSSTTPSFVSPPTVDPSSPRASPTSTNSSSSSSSSPPSTNTNASTSTSTTNDPSQRNPSKSGGSGSNTRVRSSPRPPHAPENSEHSNKKEIALGAVAMVLILGFMLVILFVQRRRKRHKQYSSVVVMPSSYNSNSQASGSSLIKPNPNYGGEFMSSPPDAGGFGNSKSWFSYDELRTATNGFASQNILGSGGFGSVYKGVLHDGTEVAVKKLKDNSGQGDREFKAEVEIISRVHHRYLVSLVGYCITEYQRLLVYEFVPNGTLHYHLHTSSKPPMEWQQRVKVACGSARGIAYLHEDCHPRIIHRDIKSPNILVDNNFEAKVADFGLAKLAQELDANTHISTRVMGTFGYMAPEYASSGKLTEKSDVFSFGVVLLEIITGRKPVDETRPLGDESLVEWARPLMTEALENGNFDELADPRLHANYDRDEMFRLMEAAAACVRHSAIKRPKMSQVVRALDSMNELSDLTNGVKPGQSGIYDSREQSAQIRRFQRMAFGSQELSSDTFNDSLGSWPSSGISGHVRGRNGVV